MSLFRPHDEILEDTRTDETVAEGVVMERRSVLRLSLATVVAALASTACGGSTRSSATPPEVVPGPSPEPAPTTAPPPSDGALEIEQLLTELCPRSRRLIADPSVGEEAYLARLGELLSRLNVPSNERMKAALQDLATTHGKKAPYELGLMLVQFELAPGKGFTHHDHRDYNGVILGVEGEVRIRNYDILGDEPVPAKGSTFQIRQTRDDLVLPGRMSSLGLQRDNVHDVTAGPQGGRVLDAFTFFSPRANSYWLDVDPKPRDAERRIFDAAWKG